MRTKITKQFTAALVCAIAAGFCANVATAQNRRPEGQLEIQRLG